ncbi:vWA domain-containing protein [Streptomyces yaizuensis]|uniref:VWA domain-containing protein n=1 Tax=Streptomyces yaizuensis TaxID=2989713 RepID=A0ABQ5P5N4_9ACTN|nr:substrate-binding domain-containing protein [Streptomyces sp. YSPA8]GLF97907.1 VWA domain-containing protein [Streptomyces sp. YSPA8]
MSPRRGRPVRPPAPAPTSTRRPALAGALRPALRPALRLALAGALLATLLACTSDRPAPLTLRVLAGSELADMGPLLDDLREETGIRLRMEYRGTVDASRELVPGTYRHDLAWLASDRYLQLRQRAAGATTEPPLTTSIMRSPVVIGMKPRAAALLRARSPDRQISWADVADAAADGSIAFAMADPRHTNSGLAALIGVATAAAGTGGVLRPADVSCDRLRGFFSGHALSGTSSERLAESFVRAQDGLDALVTYEAELLSLNRSGVLRTPLEIVHPRDGMLLAEYPLLLLDPGKRAAYDRVVAWLKTPRVQKKIMERTLRRPVDPTVARAPVLSAPIGNALYFPDQQAVVDRLLADYGAARRGGPAQVLFLLDFSTSMAGRRIGELRATFAGLSGADDSRSGRFVRFHRGESLTVLRFGGRILAERTVTYRGERDLARLRAFVASDDFDGSTALWSGLDAAYRRAAGILREHPGRPLSIVLMTDGRSNAGIGLDAFLSAQRQRTGPVRDVRTYVIRYGDADAGPLRRAARATGGRLVDAAARPLLDAFKEIRGCVH